MNAHNKRKNTQSIPTRIGLVFRDNESILRKFLRRFSSNFHDIEDMTQETILRALKAEKLQDIQEPRAFLFGVAKNIARKELDKKTKSVIDFIEDFADQGYVDQEPSMEESIDGQKQKALFMQAIATLPAQCQKVFVLKKVYGYSHQEIAKRLSISISTTEKHVAAGYKRCSEFMQKARGEQKHTSEDTQQRFIK